MRFARFLSLSFLCVFAWDFSFHSPDERKLVSIDFSIATDSRQGHGLAMSQSIRNRIQGTINEITSDKVLTEVVLNTAIGPIAAVITTRSVNELGLKVGDSVYALVKATNVSVEKA
jgi:molybdopterin-binding protein